jgi:hypothetical protein
MPIQIQVWVNSVATNLTCTFTMNWSTSVLNKATCTDNTDTVAVNPGDLVLVAMSQSTFPNGTTFYPTLNMVASLEKQ